MAQHITTHDNNGVAVFDEKASIDKLPTAEQPNGTVSFIYSTKTFPLNLSSHGDIDSSLPMRGQVPPHGQICPPEGTSVLVLSLAPGAISPMHRTMTHDVIYMLEGEVEAELDSGEKRTLKPGDSLVQRKYSQYACKVPLNTDLFSRRHDAQMDQYYPATQSKRWVGETNRFHPRRTSSHRCCWQRAGRGVADLVVQMTL
jgi:hypothetical protein